MAAAVQAGRTGTEAPLLEVHGGRSELEAEAGAEPALDAGMPFPVPSVLLGIAISPSLRRAGWCSRWALWRDSRGKGLFAMEFHAWSLLGRRCLKKGCNRWNEAAESIKARARSALQRLKIWEFIILLLPYPVVFGSWSRLHPRGACCSWQTLCFGGGGKGSLRHDCEGLLWDRVPARQQRGCV